jgi:exonuclease VII small subunit
MTLQINDEYLETIFKTKFNSDKNLFIQAIKELSQNIHQLEKIEYNLLKAYESGDLSIGQIAKILNTNEEEVLSLMAKNNIYLADEDYDFSRDKKTMPKYLTQDEALEALHQAWVESGSIPFKQARDEYLTKKYE